MQSYNSKRFKLVFISLILSFMSFNIPELCAKRPENLRIRSLLEMIPRFKGRAYSNKIHINFENNKFNCEVRENIIPKEFSFTSNSAYSICSDKIYDHTDELAKRIDIEINKTFEPKLMNNYKILNNFKLSLLFAYSLAHNYKLFQVKTSKTSNQADPFYDNKKITNTQFEIMENLPDNIFNIFNLTTGDVEILKNYLHKGRNLTELKVKINMIFENIEKYFKNKSKYQNWLVGNSLSIKYFLGIIWSQGIHIDFE